MPAGGETIVKGVQGGCLSGAAWSLVWDRRSTEAVSWNGNWWRGVCMCACVCVCSNLVWGKVLGIRRCPMSALAVPFGNGYIVHTACEWLDSESDRWQDGLEFV